MVESTKKPTEWNFNLEKSSAKESLKEPFGSKQETNEVVVRSAQKSNVTQFEVFEKVRLIECLTQFFLESMGLREGTTNKLANVYANVLVDGQLSVDLYNHVYGLNGQWSVCRNRRCQ